MANYYCNFNNQTDQTWTMAVYQTLPESIGLDSVSWKQTTVPQSGSSGVNWAVTYNVAIADYQQSGGIGVYKASQTLGASLGSAWKIVFEDNVQQLLPDGEAPQGNQILIRNQSDRTANPGIGMSGEGSVYKKGVVGGASAQFTVTPTYWAGLFNQVVLGEVISSNVIVGPFELQYPGGMNAATLTAEMDGQTIKVNTTYSSQALFDAGLARERAADIQTIRKGLAA